MLKVFVKSPRGLASLVSIGLLLVVVILAPIVFGSQANTLNIAQSSESPSLHHLLGTDALGRDIFFRILVATRLSIALALIAAGIGAVVGILAGAGAAILPLRLRSIALRTIDALIVFPGILIAILVGVIIGKGGVGAAFGVGIANSFAFARVASTLTMAISGRDYIDAARVVGIRRPRMLIRYVLPNIADTLAITTTVVISGSIVQVSALSFLGLGVQAPSYDWGVLLTEGLRNFYTSPAAALGPAAAIAISSLIFGFGGEELARVLNPLLWSRQTASTPKDGLATSTLASPGPVRSPPSDDPDTAAAGELVLEVIDLAVTFPNPGGSPLRVVDGVSFALGKGEMIGIVGESGSGKTMTAMAIANLVSYPGKVEGSVELRGLDITEIPLAEVDRVLGTNLAVVFQDPLVSLNPALKVGVQLTEGVRAHRRVTHADAVSLAVTRLRELTIPTPERQMRRYPHELSGGMQQRVMIAMGLMNDPAVLIADEPTTALDVTVQAQIMDLLWRINKEHGTSLVMISHDLGLVSQICSRVLVMYAGRVVEELTTAQLIAAPLHPYTRALVAAVPDMSYSPDVPLASIAGQVPDFSSLPLGCPFHPRCPLATEKCQTERPPLRRRPGGRRVACWVANEDMS